MMNGDVAAGRGATSSEVDAAELYGQSPIYGCQTVHLYQAPKAELSKKNCRQFGSGDGWSTDDWALRWHTYGVLIAPNVTTFYLDGKVVSTRNEVATSDQPYFFMLDEALGGGYPVQLQQTGNVSDFYVDWVKVSS
jgi:beta-glucanase (GH16 family)